MNNTYKIEWWVDTEELEKEGKLTNVLKERIDEHAEWRALEQINNWYVEWEIIFEDETDDGEEIYLRWWWKKIKD